MTEPTDFDEEFADAPGECRNCDGSGHYEGERCRGCAGTGRCEPVCGRSRQSTDDCDCIENDRNEE